MFKNNHLAGVLNFRGNGSVPSIGGTVSLASALAAVDRAEAQLEAARSQARAAAKREGKSTRHLFDGHPYVARASAERWVDEARREGEKAIADIFSRSVSMDAMDENSPFHHLAKRLQRPGAFREQQAALSDLQAAGPVAGSLADRILAAAARARSSGEHERPEPSPDSLAGQILAAAAKAHRKQGDD